MNPWFEELQAKAALDHDDRCEAGDHCAMRDRHIEEYVTKALRRRVQVAQARLNPGPAKLEELAEHLFSLEYPGVSWEHSASDAAHVLYHTRAKSVAHILIGSRS